MFAALSILTLSNSSVSNERGGKKVGVAYTVGRGD